MKIFIFLIFNFYSFLMASDSFIERIIFPQYYLEPFEDLFNSEEKEILKELKELKTEEKFNENKNRQKFLNEFLTNNHSFEERKVSLKIYIKLF